MAYRNDITADFLRTIVDYDPASGIFTWKERPIRTGFERMDRVWNSREAGKRAGGISKNGSRAISVFNIRYAEHRLAYLWMTGNWPAQEIDHINGNPSDNRWANLRPATHSENSQNTKLRSDNTSGYRGVSKCSRSNKWYAYINIDGKMQPIGRFDSKSDAYDAYMRRRSELHTFQPIPRDFMG